jgi:hypothetical protein
MVYLPLEPKVHNQQWLWIGTTELCSAGNKHLAAKICTKALDACGPKASGVKFGLYKLGRLLPCALTPELSRAAKRLRLE